MASWGWDYLATGRVTDLYVAPQFHFSYAGLEWERYVEIDQKYQRPTEVEALIGDPAKAIKILGWSAKTHWRELARIMVDADLH